MLLLFAGALGAMLELNGGGSSIQMNGATLSSTCNGLEPVVAAIAPRQNLSTFSYDAAPKVKALLQNVPASCGTVRDASFPCVPSATEPLHSMWPAGFFCEWTGVINATTGPYRATKELDFVTAGGKEQVVGVLVLVECELPPPSAFVPVALASGATTASFTLAVKYHVRVRHCLTWAQATAEPPPC